MDSGQGGSDLTGTLYTLMDLDQDGEDELLLSAAMNNVDCIYDIEGGAAVTRYTFAYRSEGNVLGNYVVTSGSSGAMYYSTNYYYLSADGSLIRQDGVFENYEKEPLIWWRGELGSDDAVAISEVDYYKVIENYESLQEPEWQELKAFSAAADISVSGEISYSGYPESLADIPSDTLEEINLRLTEGWLNMRANQRASQTSTSEIRNSQTEELLFMGNWFLTARYEDQNPRNMFYAVFLEDYSAEYVNPSDGSYVKQYLSAYVYVRISDLSLNADGTLMSNLDDAYCITSGGENPEYYITWVGSKEYHHRGYKDLYEMGAKHVEGQLDLYECDATVDDFNLF